MLPCPVKYSSFSLFSLWLRSRVSLGKNERGKKKKERLKGKVKR
jgi:hypothetical protein